MEKKAWRERGIPSILGGIFLLAIVLGNPGAILASPGEADEPVHYLGAEKADVAFHDGRLRPAVGVQNYQIMRANRTHPEWSDGVGWTYNHAPMLAYAYNQFYCLYLDSPFGEAYAPGMTMLTTSKDGKHWALPRVLFPIYLVEGKNASDVTTTFMHQRMGFYVGFHNRFLAVAFYGNNDGHGVGRVVREIYKDGGLGPIYFLRPNDNWTGNLSYPMYTKSPDVSFVTACRGLLDDKLARLQWWEEDRFCKDKDEFYRAPWLTPDKEPGKAFCWYERKDGKIVGLWKDKYAALTGDRGETWSQPVKCKTMGWGGAKVWGQRTDDGRFALVFNPTFKPERHPLSIMTGDDGINFDNLANVHGEVPVERFWGREKRPGPQYVRGITPAIDNPSGDDAEPGDDVVPTKGNPPGDDLWVVYSVNKEDIWISRIPVPVTREVTGPVADDFNKMETGGVVTGWNVYSPKWCPVEVAEFPAAAAGKSDEPDETAGKVSKRAAAATKGASSSKKEKCLSLRDRDPYDYAKAVRVFGRADRQKIAFEFYVESRTQVMDIEVLGAAGERLVQSRLDTDGSLKIRDGAGAMVSAMKLADKTWHKVEIALDAKGRKFTFALDGKPVADGTDFSEPTGEPERIEFRSGNYRLQDKVQEYKSGDKNINGWDEPGADDPVAESIFYLRNFTAGAVK